MGFFHRNGDFSVIGTLLQNQSDERLKDNKVAIPNALGKLHSITGYEFDWKEDGPQPSRGHDTGFLAQNIQQVFPQLVGPAGFDIDEHGKSKSGENYLTIASGNQITALLVEAVKELSAKLDAAVAEIAALKADK